MKGPSTVRFFPTCNRHLTRRCQFCAFFPLFIHDIERVGQYLADMSSAEAFNRPEGHASGTFAFSLLSSYANDVGTVKTLAQSPCNHRRMQIGRTFIPRREIRSGRLHPKRSRFSAAHPALICISRPLKLRRQQMSLRFFQFDPICRILGRFFLVRDCAECCRQVT